MSLVFEETLEFIFSQGALKDVNFSPIFEKLLEYDKTVDELVFETVKGEMRLGKMLESFKRDPYSILFSNHHLHVICGQMCQPEHEHDYLSIRHEIQHELDKLWNAWVKAICCIPGFISAWVVNSGYNFRQNLDDVSEYERRDWDYSHLPMMKRDLPPPLDDLIVDVSRNLGKRVIREGGYVEAVGSKMWISPEFLSLTGAQKESILACDWLEVREMPNDVLRIKAWHQPFTSDQGEEGERQRQLRNLLFPKTSPFSSSVTV